jgi:hypothetical protein
VIAALDDFAAFSHQNLVGACDRRQSAGDGEGRPVGGEFLDGLPNRQFGLGVDGAGRLVEEQDRRVREDDPRDGDALALAAGEFHAPLADE